MMPGSCGSFWRWFEFFRTILKAYPSGAETQCGNNINAKRNGIVQRCFTKNIPAGRKCGRRLLVLHVNWGLAAYCIATQVFRPCSSDTGIQYRYI